jgi:hypothetical protein
MYHIFFMLGQIYQLHLCIFYSVIVFGVTGSNSFFYAVKIVNINVIQLFFWHRVHICLCGLQILAIAILNLQSDVTAVRRASISPLGRVPVLVNGDLRASGVFPFLVGILSFVSNPCVILLITRKLHIVCRSE